MKLLMRILSKVEFWFIINCAAFIFLVSVHFGTFASHARWWNDFFAISLNLLSGGLVSFLFYYLVVYYPERRKKQLIKSNLKQMYTSIKESMMWQIVSASHRGGRDDLSLDPVEIRKLLNVEEFRKSFAGGRESTEGFYAFENEMSYDSVEFKEIIANLEILSRQIEYALHNYNIEDLELFGKFKRIERILIHLKHSEPGYDTSKPICNFIYSTFAGFDFAKGYQGHDPIEQSINNM